jgi:hypothetical protein
MAQRRPPGKGRGNRREARDAALASSPGPVCPFTVYLAYSFMMRKEFGGRSAAVPDSRRRFRRLR